jgi:hypothetical protein
MTLPVKTISDFYIRNPNVQGFNIDANTPHLSARADGTFDDVVQLYAANGANLPNRLQDVHISWGGPSSVTVNTPTTIFDVANTDGRNDYELNFPDGSLVDVWQQSIDNSADGGDVYASYNGLPHLVWSTSNTDSLLGATPLADGKIAALVYSGGGNEWIVIQSKDGSGTTVHLPLSEEWDTNAQNGSIIQLDNGDLVADYQDSSGLLHQEIISETGTEVLNWSNATHSAYHNQYAVAAVDPRNTLSTNGAGYVTVVQADQLNKKAGTWTYAIEIERTDDAGNLVSTVNVAGNSENAATNHDVNIARLADGGFVVVWDDSGVIYGRNFHFDATNTNLVADDAQYQISNGPANTYAYEPSVTGLADGRYAVAWEEIGPSQSYWTSKAAIFDSRTAGMTFNAISGGSNLVGTTFNDTFNGGPGNDTFSPNGGTDTINGGAGWNRVIYNVSWTLANFTHNADGSWTVFSTGFTDTISNVELLNFTDRSIALRRRAVDDFASTNVSDILFRNDTSGDTWFEAMSNGAFAGWNQIGGSNTDYAVAGVGDFYGTGTDDALFRNNSTGDTWIETMSNGAFSGWNDIGGSDTHFSVVGVGDFYGNGADDVLFRNASTGDTWIEAIIGGSVAGWHQVGGSDTSFAAVGVGDFYGNGIDDILFRNASTGDTWIGVIANGALKGWSEVGGSDTHYAVVGVGDYFGNGTDDILFRNNSTGDTWIEAMSNGASAGWQPVGGSNTSYTVVAVGDYFGNGTSDILFRNNSTGDTWFEAISNGASAGWNHIGGSSTAYTVVK